MHKKGTPSVFSTWDNSRPAEPLVIQQGRVIDPVNGIDRVATVVCAEGKIVDVVDEEDGEHIEVFID